MGAEKILCMIAMGVAGVLSLVFLLDAALGIPFSRASVVFDVLAIIGGAFILWQGLETYKEFR